MQGCENIFLQVVEVSKEGFWKNAFFFCLFYVGERKRENMKTWKRKIPIKPRKKSVFSWLWTKAVSLLKWHLLDKIGKHYMYSEGKNAHFRWHYLFWKCHFFVTIQNHQTPQNRGFSRHRDNPKWHFWLQKCHLGKGPRKGGFTICDEQKLCSAENMIFIVLSACLLLWQKTS